MFDRLSRRLCSVVTSRRLSFVADSPIVNQLKSSTPAGVIRLLRAMYSTSFRFPMRRVSLKCFLMLVVTCGFTCELRPCLIFVDKQCFCVQYVFASIGSIVKITAKTHLHTHITSKIYPSILLSFNLFSLLYR